MDRNADRQAFEVLQFMARNTQHRALYHEVIVQDMERWPDLKPEEKLTVYERNVRRFKAACPTLATKDRIRDAAEALRWALSWRTEDLVHAG